MNREITRRQFLKTAAVATLAAGGMDASAAGRSPSALVDANISLGHWPYRRLPLDETSALVSKLRKHGVTQAWTANLNALIGADVGASNAWLASECEKRGRKILIPFGTVNLAQPNWEAEYRRCHSEHGMAGMRLYPNYHRYELSSPAFEKLLSLAAEHRMIVQIAVSMEDERTQPASAQVPHVDVKPLLTLLKNSRMSYVVLLNWQRAVKPEVVKELAAQGVNFDIATVETVGGVATLAEQISAERVLFGSHAPLFYFESAQFKLNESTLDANTMRAVSYQNAIRLRQG